MASPLCSGSSVINRYAWLPDDRVRNPSVWVPLSQAAFGAGPCEHVLKRFPFRLIAYSSDVNGVFRRDVNRHSGDVNKVGSQRRWDCNHA
jgi:hypothetical protein